MIVTRSNAVTNIFVKIFGRLPPQLTTEVIISWRHLFSLTTVRYMSTSRLSLSLCTTHTVPASKPLAVTPSLDAKANENFYKFKYVPTRENQRVSSENHGSETNNSLRYQNKFPACLRLSKGERHLTHNKTGSGPRRVWREHHRAGWPHRPPPSRNLGAPVQRARQ